MPARGVKSNMKLATGRFKQRLEGDGGVDR
jgi:hypothetical protein